MISGNLLKPLLLKRFQEKPVVDFCLEKDKLQKGSKPKIERQKLIIGNACCFCFFAVAVLLLLFLLLVLNLGA